MKHIKGHPWLAVVIASAVITSAFLWPRSPAYGQNASIEHAFMNEQIKLFRNLIGLIGDMREVADDPSYAGVMAVMSVEDRVHEHEHAIRFLETMLPHTEDEVVRRAIRIQLADHYKEIERPNESLEQLAILITGRSVEFEPFDEEHERDEHDDDDDDYDRDDRDDD